MGEKFELYNGQGQVEDPNIAHEMANAEKPYREKRILGIFKDKKGIKKGEQLAEATGRYHIDKLNQKQKLQEVSESIKSFEFFEGGIRMETNGHQLEIFGEIRIVHLPPKGREVFKFIGTSGKIDGNELSNDHLKKIVDKFSDFIVDKGGEEKMEEVRNKIKMGQKKKEEIKKLESERQQNERLMQTEKEKEAKKTEQERQAKLSENNNTSVGELLK